MKKEFKNIDTIIFDMDGVIIDSEPYWVKQNIKFLNHHNIQASEKDIFPMIGMDEKHSLIYYSEKFFIEKSVIEIKEIYDNYFDDLVTDFRQLVFSDVKEVLQWLKKQDYTLALASNTNYDTILIVLEQLEIREYFDVVVSGQHFKKGKPDPAIYLHTLEELNKSSGQSLVIEDSKAGIKASKNANIYTLGIKDTRFNIDQSEADLLIDNLSELIKILSQ